MRLHLHIHGDPCITTALDRIEQKLDSMNERIEKMSEQVDLVKGEVDETVAALSVLQDAVNSAVAEIAALREQLEQCPADGLTQEDALEIAANLDNVQAGMLAAAEALAPVVPPPPPPPDEG